MNTESTPENQLELPILEIVNGETITFHRLTMDDLLKWSGELQTRRRIDAETRLKKDDSLSPFDRQRMLQAIADEGVALGTLVLQKSFSPEGIRRILMTSLKKTPGVDDTAALNTLKRIHFTRQSVIAQDVLNPPAPPEEKQAEGDSGNANPPDGGTGDSASQ